MKKLARIVIAAIAISAAAWSTLWFAGRAKVEARLDAEEAQLAAQGYTVSHAAREIGGFPFGYAVTYRELRAEIPGIAGQAGAAYVLPRLTADISAGNVDRITMRFPEKFYIEAPVDAAMRAANPELPEHFKVEVEAQGMTAALDGLMSAEREVTVAADSMLMVTAGPAQEADIAIEFIGVETGMTLLPLTDNRLAPSRFLVDRVEYAIAAAGAGKAPAVLKGSIDAVRMTGSTDLRRPGYAMEALFAGKGISNVAYQTGASTGALTMPKGAGTWSGAVTYATGSSAGTMGIENGVLRWNATGQANRFAVSMADGAQNLGAEMRAIEFGYAMPFAPSDQMAPLVFRLALDQVTLDEALWALIDAGGVLPRDPARLIIDTEAAARVTQRLDQVQPGQAPPIELGPATIRAADLTALGAKVTARGDLEFLPPVQQPVGTITVTLTNVFQLVNKLAEAGLLAPEKAQMAIAMATGFTVAGAAPGERVSVVELTQNSVTVNGMRLGQ